jgi:MFS transporter, FSR family, fosmidomycin resistance protein
MKIKGVSLIVLSHAASDINQGAIPVLLPFFIAEHHINYAMAASFVFAVNLVSTLAQPLSGHITDRHSRPWLIPVAMLVIGLGVAFAAVAPSYRLGLAALMVSGLAIAVYHPEGARLMNYLAEEKKATAMSLFGIGGQLGFAIGPIMATAALLAFGLKGMTLLVIPTIIVAALVMYRLPELSSGYVTRGAAKNTEARHEGKDAWPAFACLASALLCRSVIFYGLNTFLPLFWIDVLGQSKVAAGFALAVLLGSSIVGNFLGGGAADRFGYRKVSIGGFALLAAFTPFLALSHSALWATLLLIPIGLVLSAPFGPMVVLGQSYLPNRIGLASGVTLGLGFSFGGLITPLLGWVADNHGLRAAISIVAFIPLLCTGLVLLLPREKGALPTGFAEAEHDG